MRVIFTLSSMAEEKPMNYPRLPRPASVREDDPEIVSGPFKWGRLLILMIILTLLVALH